MIAMPVEHYDIVERFRDVHMAKEAVGREYESVSAAEHIDTGSYERSNPIVVAEVTHRGGPMMEQHTSRQIIRTDSSTLPPLTRVPGSIENGVLFGHDGELFLAHGGHHVLDIASGKREVPPEIFAAFRSNIESRVRYADRLGVQYVHAISPDKQAILRDKFTVQNPICLGERHLKASPSIAAHVFYPVDLLRNEDGPLFMKTDTHMTDRGTILAVTSLVERLSDEGQTERRNALLRRTTIERSHIGDLGLKLESPPSHIERFLAVDWKFRWFENGIRGGNNGIVDIYFSPNAVYPRRLLWFGDSFGREAARLLSFYFHEVVFLRTPFFHPEICDQISPDILITQNVERYLASCQPDEMRPSFFMYPHIKGLHYEPSKEFAEAFSAVLSFPRPPYHAFVRLISSHPSLMTEISDPKDLLDPSSRLASQTIAQFNKGKVVSEVDQEAVAPTITTDFLELSEASRALAAKMGIVAEIHSKDFIFRFVARKWQGNQDRAVANYYQLGDYSAKLSREILNEVIKVRKVLKDDWLPGQVLDFASGYGCVSRHLAQALPDSAVSTCDIHPEAVAFNSSVLGLASALSSSKPEELALPPQDLILALSFFSHMPKTTWVRWLQALASSLAPGGVLVFTANGYVTDKLGNIRVEVMDDGFGFRAESEQRDLKGEQYGITISYPRWVLRALDECPQLRLARFQEGLWWAVQDTYVCVRSP